MLSCHPLRSLRVGKRRLSQKLVLIVYHIVSETEHVLENLFRFVIEKCVMLRASYMIPILTY